MAEEKSEIIPCFRGEVYYADLGRGVGSEQEGFRPVVIIQNDVGNKFGNTTIIAPISCSIQSKAKLPTHCLLEPTAGLLRPSIVLLEQIRVIDKRRLKRRVGELPDQHIIGIERALKISVGLSSVSDQNIVCLCSTCARIIRRSGAFSLGRRGSSSHHVSCMRCTIRSGMEYEMNFTKL